MPSAASIDIGGSSGDGVDQTQNKKVLESNPKVFGNLLNRKKFTKLDNQFDSFTGRSIGKPGDNSTI